MNILRFLFFVLLTLAARPAMASNLYINADNLKIIKEQGVAVYKGNVVAKWDDSIRGNVALETSKVEIYYNIQQKSISKIVAPDKVKAISLNADGGEEIALADKAQYDADNGSLILLGNIKVVKKTSDGDEYFFLVDELEYTLSKNLQLKSERK